MPLRLRGSEPLTPCHDGVGSDLAWVIRKDAEGFGRDLIDDPLCGIEQLCTVTPAHLQHARPLTICTVTLSDNFFTTDRGTNIAGGADPSQIRTNAMCS